MSEKPPTARGAASAAGSEKAERLRLILVAGGILVALALAVAMLRFYRLSELRAWALCTMKRRHSLDALQRAGRRARSFLSLKRAMAARRLVVYAIALAISFLGRTAAGCSCAYSPGQRGHGLFRLLGWAGSSLGRTKKADGPPRGAVCWSAELGLALMAVSRQSDDPGSHCVKSHLPAIAFFHCVWLCSGGGGGNGSAAAEPGGGSCTGREYAPGCCRTLIFQRV